MAKILIIDDEPSIRTAITLALKDQEHEVYAADSKSSAVEIISQIHLDLIISDLFIPDEIDGIEILKFAKKNQPNGSILMITAHSSIERVVELMKLGADDFLAKGFTMDELNFRIQKLLNHLQLRQENQRLQQEVGAKYSFDQIIGKSKNIRELKQMLTPIVDDPDSTILLQGESGTGKELVARAIHFNGMRHSKPFVVVNCAALPEHLLESELFGYEKGAFTGAIKEKPGKFEVANGGTVFLDEIGEISKKVQVELLRFTQERSFERLGSNKSIRVDVRIIAATNKDLSNEVSAGRFREDLYYRLNVIPITIPPLREHFDDIPLLIQHLIENHRDRKKRFNFSSEAILKLQKYHWPGNVRELENLVERMIVTAPADTILANDLPVEFLGNKTKNSIDRAFDKPSLKEACFEFERLYLRFHLEENHWNISEVARILGERRDTMSKKIKRHNLKTE